jgi:hypothetical protein
MPDSASLNRPIQLQGKAERRHEIRPIWITPTKQNVTMPTMSNPFSELLQTAVCTKMPEHDWEDAHVDLQDINLNPIFT